MNPRVLSLESIRLLSFERMRQFRIWQGHWRRMLISPRYRRLQNALSRARGLGPWGEARNARLLQHSRELASRAEMLPPRPVSAAADDEIHMLCGNSHVSMGRVCLWSLLRWLPFDVAVYVHNDGTMTKEDEDAWRRSFPNLKIVSRADMEESRAAFFAEGRYPRLREFSSHLYSPKVIDFHLAGTSRRVIVLDTDILFFKRPDEFIETQREMAESGRPIFTFYDDTGNFYAAPRKLIASKIGPILPRFNSGMCLIPRFGEKDFDLIEEILEKLDGTFPGAIRHLWVEQTIYATTAARHEPRRMPRDYAVGASTGRVISTHYAGHFRELFFTEGLARLG